MHARWLSFVIWALLAASLAYWSLTLMSRGPMAPAQVQPAFASAAGGDWTRVFTQEAAAAPVEATSSRYVLLGVVAPSVGRGAGEGVALISISGGYARPFRVGQVVEGDLELVDVSRREASLGRGGVVSVRLALAPVSGMSPQADAPPPGPSVPNQPPPGMPGGPGGPGAPLPPNQQGISLNAGPGSSMAPNGGPLAVGGALPQGVQEQRPDNPVKE